MSQSFEHAPLSIDRLRVAAIGANSSLQPLSMHTSSPRSDMADAHASKKSTRPCLEEWIATIRDGPAQGGEAGELAFRQNYNQLATCTDAVALTRLPDIQRICFGGCPGLTSSIVSVMLIFGTPAPFGVEFTSWPGKSPAISR